jgi:hypothetical protein
MLKKMDGWQRGNKKGKIEGEYDQSDQSTLYVCMEILQWKPAHYTNNAY